MMPPQSRKEEYDGHNTGDLPISISFNDRLVTLNHFERNGFTEWLLTPDMLFGAANKWWGDKGRRSTPHEGIDLVLFYTLNGRTVELPAGTIIPAAFDGTVVGFCSDFLGQSIFMKHEQYRRGSVVLVTAFGHTGPAARTSPGARLREGDIVGTVADTRNRPNSASCHLHISGAWVPEDLSPDQFNWDTFINPEKVTLIDPLRLLKLPYSMEKVRHLG